LLETLQRSEIFMVQPETTARRRTPRRLGRHRRLAAAVAQALRKLDTVDRRAPLPAEFVASVVALCQKCRRVLGRAEASLAVGPVEAVPMAPGAALVILLKLHVALERATKNADTRSGRRRP
jgi:hypothetical protein